jgi:cytochrome c oxidase subunit II
LTRATPQPFDEESRDDLMRRLAARPRLRTLVRTAASLLLIGLLGGCLFPPTPETNQSKEVFSLYTIVFVMGAVVFFGVEGAIVWSIIRYRRRDDRLPDQLHGNTLIEILWTAIPTVIVMFLFVLSTITLTSIDAKAANPAVTIEVTGFQWQWTFRYLNPSDHTKVDYEVTGTAANQPVMGLPVGQPIHLILKSSDVIHSFFVPHFLVKRDVIPFPASIQPNELDFTITDAGTYGGQCAEFCGDLHSRMTFSVQAMSPADYDQWLAGAKAGKTPPPSGTPAPGATVIELSAQNTAFNTSSLSAPASKPFVLRFDNKDPIAHNVGIYDASGKEVFTGDIFPGPKSVDYQVPALPAGTYTFKCDVHPTIMFGTLSVQ